MLEEPPQVQSIVRSERISSSEAHSMLAQFLTAQKRFLASFPSNDSNIHSGASQIDDAKGSVSGTQQSEEDEEAENEATDYDDDEEALTKARNMTQLLEGFLSCLSTVDPSNKIADADVNVNVSVNSIEKNDIIEENIAIADETTKRTIEPKTEEVEPDTITEGEQEQNIITESTTTTPMTDKKERSKVSTERKRIKKEHKRKRKSSEKKSARKGSKRMRKNEKGDY